MVGNDCYQFMNKIIQGVAKLRPQTAPSRAWQQQSRPQTAALRDLQRKNLSKNFTTFVLTSHPTNLELNLKDKNGNPRKPTIYEENKHYHKLLATNPVPENTEIWFGYDMDRHPEESPNVFPYAFLQKHA